ncbi:MAG: hypothetical protein ACLQJR_35385 [Stellaceae bacterium]
MAELSRIPDHRSFQGEQPYPLLPSVLRLSAGSPWPYARSPSAIPVPGKGGGFSAAPPASEGTGLERLTDMAAEGREPHALLREKRAKEILAAVAGLRIGMILFDDRGAMIGCRRDAAINLRTFSMKLQNHP